MVGQNQKQNSTQRDNEQYGLDDIGDDGAAQTALERINQCCGGEQQCGRNESPGAGLPVIGADHCGVAPHLVIEADQDGQRERERGEPAVTRDQERHQSGGAMTRAQPVDDDAGDRDRQPVSGIGQAADHTPGRTEIGGVGHGFGKNPADENAAHQRPLGSGPAGVIAAGEKTGGGARARRDRIHRAAVEQQEAPEINCECRFDHLLLFAFSLPARRRSSNPARRCSRSNGP